MMKRTPNVKQMAKVVRDDWDDDDDDDEEDEGVAQGVQEIHQTGKALKAGGNRTDSMAPVLCTATKRAREQALSEQHDGDEESSKIWEEA